MTFLASDRKEDYMTHTAKERLNAHKEKHAQFQSIRTDAEDWDGYRRSLLTPL